MSHEVETMAYMGETPWHGLGQHLPEGGTVEEWKVAAGMEWTIEKAGVRYNRTVGPHSGMVAMDDRHVLYRSDTGGALGVVSSKYRPVQPGEVLEFYRELVGSDGMFTLETAGVLKQGRKLWALARRNAEIKVGGTDVLLPYLLLATSCDGTLATTAKFTTVRVVCNNTLQMSLDGQNQVKIPHHTDFNIARVHDQLGLIDLCSDSFEKKANTLAGIEVSEREAAVFFTQVVGTQDQLAAYQKDGDTSKTVTELLELYKTAPGAELVTADGTAWGLVNAVTRFYDHERFSHGGRDNRLNSAWFGKGNAMKDRAVRMALAMAA